MVHPLFVWLVGFLTSSSATRLYRKWVPRLTSDNFMCCHIETERGDHDFSLSRSHYTDMDPTSRVCLDFLDTRLQTIRIELFGFNHLFSKHDCYGLKLHMPYYDIISADHNYICSFNAYKGYIIIVCNGNRIFEVLNLVHVRFCDIAYFY